MPCARLPITLDVRFVRVVAPSPMAVMDPICESVSPHDDFARLVDAGKS